MGAGRRERGELEAQVMDVLWRAPDPLTPAQVRVQLGDEDLAYTTVMTILVRLWRKGLAERAPAGRAFVYWPAAPRDEWVAQRMREYLALAGEPEAALGHFVSGMERRDARALRRILGRKPPRR